jgi:beta-carotene 15,15'-dioxygenase
MDRRDVATTLGWSTAPVGYRVDADWRTTALIPEEPPPPPALSGSWIASLAITLVAVAVSAVVGVVPSPSVSAVLLMLAAAIGMPHGALDIVAGPVLAIRATKKTTFALFLILYTLLAASFAVGWFLKPQAGIVAFFGMSWFHFGAGDAGGDRLGWSVDRVAHAVCSGGITIALPIATHTGRVMPMVTALLFGRPAPSQHDVMRIGFAGVAVTGVAFAVVAARCNRDLRGRVVAELTVLAALFVVADPLIAFSVYFCVWHAPRHTGRVLGALPSGLPRKTSRLLVVAATLLPLVGVGGLLLNQSHVTLPTSDVLYQIVFVTLGALTVPHLVITAVWERGRRAKDDRIRFPVPRPGTQEHRTWERLPLNLGPRTRLERLWDAR